MSLHRAQVRAGSGGPREVQGGEEEGPGGLFSRYGPFAVAGPGQAKTNRCARFLSTLLTIDIMTVFIPKSAG